MSQNNFLLKYFDKNYILKTFYLVLLLSLFLIIDFFIALHISRFISNYLLMFLLSISGFVGLFLGFFRVKSMLGKILHDVNRGVFDQKSMYSYFGSIFGCVLLILPGFLTDLLGIILLVSLLKSMAGRLVLGTHREKLKSLYEYLKLY
ncbi:MAG: FxsA family protein [Spirochaetales bacterium]|nr:FxsA family protein [Spirochaetales bacterium]